MTTADETRIDAAALAALHTEFDDELYPFLVGILRDRDLAGDALQATWVRALEHGHTARSESVRGWLFRVAYNEAMQIRRKQQVNERSLRGLSWISPALEGAADEPVLREEDAEKVRQALEGLSAEQQDVVRKRVYENKTFATIAQETGAPLGTVLTRMRLALKKLTMYLSPPGDSSGGK